MTYFKNKPSVTLGLPVSTVNVRYCNCGSISIKETLNDLFCNRKDDLKTRGSVDLKSKLISKKQGKKERDTKDEKITSSWLVSVYSVS